MFKFLAVCFFSFSIYAGEVNLDHIILTNGINLSKNECFKKAKDVVEAMGGEINLLYNQESDFNTDQEALELFDIARKS